MKFSLVLLALFSCCCGAILAESPRQVKGRKYHEVEGVSGGSRSKRTNSGKRNAAVVSFGAAEHKPTGVEVETATDLAVNDPDGKDVTYDGRAPSEIAPELHYVTSDGINITRDALRVLSSINAGANLLVRSIEAVQPVAEESLALGRVLVQRALRGTPTGKAGKAKLYERIEGFTNSVIGASRKLAPIADEVFRMGSRIFAS